MTKETLQFLLNLVSQVSIKAGQDDFDQAYKIIANAKSELRQELSKDG